MKKKKTFQEEVIQTSKDKTLTNRLNRFLSNKYILTITIIGLDILFFLLFNYVVNSLAKVFSGSLENGFENVFSFRNIFFDMFLFIEWSFVKLVYLFFVITMIVLDFLLIYQVKTYLSVDNFNVNQKGESRFTTVKEIKEQYKEIPDRDFRYSGAGGTIISRIGDKLYIDTSPTNNLIFGITRSGKGEFFVFPSIDVYSRAEIQPSMIIADPKLELYRSSKKTLEERGYEVHLLNLIDPLASMGYNPLSLIIDYYKEGKFDEAELMADSFAYSVFNPGKANNSGNDKFFDQTAGGVFAALILSHVEDCLQEDEILNDKRLKEFNKKRANYDMEIFENEDRKDELDRSFYSLKEKLQKSGEDYISHPDVKYIPEGEAFYYLDKYEKCINVYSILNTLIELSQYSIENTDDSALDEFFRQRPPLDAGKMRYASALVAGDRTKGSILANTTQGLKVFTSRAIAKMTAESTLDLRKIGFGEKPIAIFMGIPDYDRSKHFLPVTFIRQVYYYLAETCSKTTGKCKRPVKFIIDEFGNMPAIDDMGNMITVCLGRNISFDLYIQGYSQLSEVYGEAGETIEANCGNKIYILSNGYDTAEKFSNLLGKESIVTLQRSGEKLALKKTFTEQIEEKPLLDPNRLLKLKQGECVVIRSMKRKDNEGNDITPHPIFNSTETGTQFKYRYQYLQETFPDPDSIDLDSVITESRRGINVLERIWDYEISFERYEEKANNETVPVKKLKDCSDYIYNAVMNNLHEELGENLERYGIPSDGDISISKLMDFINKNRSINNFRKSTLLGLLSGSEV